MVAADRVDGPDSWGWLGDKSGVFSVNSVKKLAEKDRDSSNNYIMKWSKWVPDKCNIHAWRVELNRVPTWEALDRRKIQGVRILCPFCDIGLDTIDHLTTGCSVASTVWDHVTRWCKVPPFFGFSVRDVLELSKLVGLLEKDKEAFHGIVIVACWSIWKARNERIFEKKNIKIDSIIGEIKSLGFLWYNSRSKKDKIDWWVRGCPPACEGS
ncbi:uncharacterized protein LOC143539312 [Bidens hawaiensis]|uniref:uncharacterized protein LOC143539312 n=1 Tax=Bidens hawaiensis TaxID=980011 RepID=UPI00404A451F